MAANKKSRRAELGAFGSARTERGKLVSRWTGGVGAFMPTHNVKPCD